MSRRVVQSSLRLVPGRYDVWVVGATLCLLSLGLIMVASASFDVAERSAGKNAFHFLQRQAAFVAAGLLIGWMLLRVPLLQWCRAANVLLVAAGVLLVLVFVPAIGGEPVNGATRWIDLGIFKVQASEIAKLALVVYYAAYLSQHREQIAGPLRDFAVALIPLGVVAMLVLAEPDLGATVVMGLTVLGLFFLAGVRLMHFGLLLGVLAAGFAALVLTADWRLARLVSFLDPCSAEYSQNHGYQLCQALIAFSRGEWLGVGLGSGVQKLFYLPEAHTDFLLAVLGEELGVLGSVLVVALFSILVYRALLIGRRCAAEHDYFAGFVAYGIGLWLGVQAFINIAVNMGLLPTKGLTLPLMSYGGSSIVVTCAAIALLLRCDYEWRAKETRAVGKRGLWAAAS